MKFNDIPEKDLKTIRKAISRKQLAELCQPSPKTRLEIKNIAKVIKQRAREAGINPEWAVIRYIDLSMHAKNPYPPSPLI